MKEPARTREAWLTWHIDTEIERRMQPGAWDGPASSVRGRRCRPSRPRMPSDPATWGSTRRPSGRRLGELLDAGADSDIGRPATVGAFRVELLRAAGS